MYILTDKESGGVYAVNNKDQIKTVQIFEDEDDAYRYYEMLRADDYKDELEVFEVDLDIVAANCQNYGYYYSIITKNDFVIPPTT